MGTRFNIIISTSFITSTTTGRWSSLISSRRTLFGKRVVSTTDTCVRLGRRNDNNITSSSSTSSSTKLTDNHVQHSILEKRLVFSSCEESQLIIIMSKSPTFTRIRTPRPALNTSSSGVENNVDLVTTSSLKERSHFEGVETVVISERLSSSSNVNLHTSSEGVFTVVFSEGIRNSNGRPRVSRETVFHNHLSISLDISRSDLDVEMHVHLESSGSRTRGGHDPEDIAEFLVSRTEGTSSSNGGEMGRRQCKSSVEYNFGSCLEFVISYTYGSVRNQVSTLLGKESEMSSGISNLLVRLITSSTNRTSSSTTGITTTTVTTPLSFEESELQLLSRSTGGHG